MRNVGLEPSLYEGQKEQDNLLTRSHPMGWQDSYINLKANS